MRRSVTSRLRSANPVTRSTPAPIQLFERITGESPRNGISPWSGARLRSRMGKTTLLGFAGLLLCVGAAWSATGNNPVAVVIKQAGNRLMPPEPGTNLFASDRAPMPAGLSLLRPADRDSIEALPRFTLEGLQLLQIGFRQSDLDSVRTEGRKLEDLPRVIHPKFVRGLGEAELPSGQAVSVVALKDEICAFWLRVEEAMCGSDREFSRRGIYQYGDFSGRQGPWDILGLVDDRVAAVSARSDSVTRRTRVEDNVFELRNLPKYDVTLVAYDGDGRELYRSLFR